MLNWIKKATIITAAFTTLGFTVPTGVSKAIQSEQNSLTKSENISPDKQNVIILDEQTYTFNDPAIVEDLQFNDLFPAHYFFEIAVEQAYKQGLMKFGPKISAKVGEEFEEEILPKFKEVIEQLGNEIGISDFQYLKVTDAPSSGLGEKILHIYDERSGADVIRLHVRRDNPPRKGYWFNFHYHLSNDNFQTHHHLGDIYWDKNTPPKWSSIVS